MDHQVEHGKFTLNSKNIPFLTYPATCHDSAIEDISFYKWTQNV